MPVQLRWTSEADLDRVARTRMLCYAPAMRELPKYQEGIRADRRGVPEDHLLAEDDGRPVGTATSLSFHMWVRGGRVPCQGVAYVGTIKTQRRKGGAPGGGVASQIMREVLRKGRERGQVVSALMPFRASFYEHFGYGVVERRAEWKLPIAVLPVGDCEGVRLFESGDLPALSACRQRQVERGQCDIERTPEGWEHFFRRAEEGFVVVDRSKDGAIHGYQRFTQGHEHGRDAINVHEMGYDDIESLRRQLYFLATLRDQFAAAAVSLPADVPLSWMLRETQLPHRPVNHPAAELRTITRMQVRMLDHKRLIEAMRFPVERCGRVSVAIREMEGQVSRFLIDLADGRASVTPTESSPQFECTDRIWAAVVCGNLPASQAVMLGLARADRDETSHRLDVFSDGSAPFCQEYF